MYRDLTISLVIPTLNEEHGIENVLQQVPKEVDEVIIVDGGSTDRTVEIAKKYNATVIVEPKRGYGLAFLRGFAAAQSDIITTTDGDGTYPVRSIPQLVDALVEKKADFVSGCRFPLEDPTSMYYRNFIGNALMTGFTALLFKEKITDVASGMWVFRRNILQKFNFIDTRWNFSLEIKMEAMLHQNVKFVEQHISYYERIGESKVERPWIVGLRALLFCLKKKFVYLTHKKQYV